MLSLYYTSYVVVTVTVFLFASSPRRSRTDGSRPVYDVPTCVYPPNVDMQSDGFFMVATRSGYERFGRKHCPDDGLRGLRYRPPRRIGAWQQPYTYRGKYIMRSTHKHSLDTQWYCLAVRLFGYRRTTLLARSELALPLLEYSRVHYYRSSHDVGGGGETCTVSNSTSAGKGC